MDSAKNQLADKLKTASNVLVTVSRNPSVDQLSSLLGLTLALNKMGKHAAAVFSGKIPSTLEFLKPEDTFEKNTDSLRDFIIALDKAKADKLRYKVEDDVVRIFITPYKTSISDADLEFSQGDFNVDLVIALGVEQQEDLDEAITAHGRILHDATVASINVTHPGAEGLGSINWHDDTASSLGELVTSLVQVMGKDLFDEQISTALLTGIVAETHRFSNEKTSSETMSMSALLMSAGANQQLVATKLDEPAPQPEVLDVPNNTESYDADTNEPDDDTDNEPPKIDDGSIAISHDPQETREEPAFELPAPESESESESESEEEPAPEVESEQPNDNLSEGSRLIVDEPQLGGQLTANSKPEALDPAIDPLREPSENKSPLLTRSQEPITAPLSDETPEFTPPPASWTPPAIVVESTPEPEIVIPDTPAEEEAQVETAEHAPTLSELEAAIKPSDEPEAKTPTPDVDDARDEVNKALSSSDVVQPLGAIDALNAQPLGESLHLPETPALPELDASASYNGYTSVEDLLGNSADTSVPTEPATPPEVIDPNAPPPVPPPLPFNFNQPPPQQ